MTTVRHYLDSFSEISENEKVLVTGGKSAHPFLESIGNWLISNGEKNRGTGNSGGAAGEVIKEINGNNTVSAISAGVVLVGCAEQAIGSALIWIAKNDPGDIDGAMNRYYEHH